MATLNAVKDLLRFRLGGRNDDTPPNLPLEIRGGIIGKIAQREYLSSYNSS